MQDSIAVVRFLEDSFKPGDIVSHDWLKWALDLKEPRTADEFREYQWKWLSAIEQFKDELLVNHKIALRNVRGTGYQVVPPEAQAQYAVEHGMKAVRKGIGSAQRLLEHAKIDSMDSDSRRRHIDAQAKMDGLAGMVRRGKRDVFALFGK